jgi:hypothetical protein
VAGEHREEHARVAIVSTTINPAPASYREWAKQGDLIVAGDVNTPVATANFIEDIGGEYLSVGDQEKWEFSDSIGWSSIQRRNAAIMTAYSRRYDYIVTVDDDNWPTDAWVNAHIAHILGDLPENTVKVQGDGDWVDPGMFVSPSHHMRGTPYGVVRNHNIFEVTATDVESIVVSTAQVLGDPDCDAVTRLVKNPKVFDVLHNIIVDRNSWAAFNSQATVWEGSWAPLMAVLPHVGRYDDIIASFIAKSIMRSMQKTIYVGEPCVRQYRNAHDIVGDLRNEYYGMKMTPYIIKALDTESFSPETSLTDAYGACIDAIAWYDALHPAALNFMRMWLQAWREIDDRGE